MQPAEEDSGSFAHTPFSHLLIRALDRRWTGTLTIAPEDERLRHLCAIEHGLVSRALGRDRHALLGEVLVGCGVIMAAELDLALAEPGPLGRALLARNLVDESTLARALELQLLSRLVRIFAFGPSTTYAFAPGLDAFAAMPPGVRSDALRVLWAGIQAHGEVDGLMEPTLARLGDAVLVVRPELRLGRFGFGGDALAAATVLHGEPMTLAELCEEQLAPPETCRRVVYVLAITRYLAPRPPGAGAEPRVALASDPPGTCPDGSEAPLPSRQQVARIRLRRVAVARAAAPDEPGQGEPVSAPPPAEQAAGDDDWLGASSAAAARALCEQRVAGLARETPFTLLEVDPEALRGEDDDQVTERLWTAYEACSRRWDPDRCPAELADLREGCRRIHDAITEAFVTLADGEGRAGWLARARPDPAIAASAAVGQAAPGPPAAAELYERAMFALSERRAAEALEACQKACDLVPDHPDYQAAAVWIRASLPRPDLKVLTLDLDDILRAHEDHLTARFYRGVLRRRLGYDAAAKQDFERVLLLDPSHVAARAQLGELVRGSR